MRTDGTTWSSTHTSPLTSPELPKQDHGPSMARNHNMPRSSATATSGLFASQWRTATHSQLHAPYRRDDDASSGDDPRRALEMLVNSDARAARIARMPHRPLLSTKCRV